MQRGSELQRVTGAWHPGKLVGERKMVREVGRGEGGWGEGLVGCSGEWEEERMLVSGWKELKDRSDPAANFLGPSSSGLSPPVCQTRGWL